MISHLLLGVLLGAASTILPGPCSLAVINASYRHGLRRAVATGFGAAFGDATYAALGIVGLGRVLVCHPNVPCMLQLVSGLALIVYGVSSLLSRPKLLASRAPAGASQDDRVLKGLGVGLGLLLANPGALVTWVVIVGSTLGTASPIDQWCTVIGIGTGSFAWFTGVAHLSWHGKTVLGGGMQRITILVSALLVAYGLISLARAAHGYC
jgi:threonine/homoserine/homoserine lactone efflux protein